MLPPTRAATVDASASGDSSRVIDDRDTRSTVGVGSLVGTGVGSAASIGVRETAFGAGPGIDCDSGVGPAGLPALETTMVGAAATSVGGADSVGGCGRRAVGDPWSPGCDGAFSGGVYVASDWQPASKTAIVIERSAAQIPFLNTTGPCRRRGPCGLFWKKSITKN